MARGPSRCGFRPRNVKAIGPIDAADCRANGARPGHRLLVPMGVFLAANLQAGETVPGQAAPPAISASAGPSRSALSPWGRGMRHRAGPERTSAGGSSGAPIWRPGFDPSNSAATKTTIGHECSKPQPGPIDCVAGTFLPALGSAPTDRASCDHDGANPPWQGGADGRRSGCWGGAGPGFALIPVDHVRNCISIHPRGMDVSPRGATIASGQPDFAPGSSGLGQFRSDDLRTWTTPTKPSRMPRPIAVRSR